MKKQTDISTSKVGKFLKSCTESERIYLRNIIDISNSIRNLIKKGNLSKQWICTRFNVPVRKYNDFISGNYNYDLKHIAILDSEHYAINRKSVIVTKPDNE